MEIFKIIFDACYEILKIEIHVFEYDISLLGVLSFVIVGSFLFAIFYGLLDR